MKNSKIFATVLLAVVASSSVYAVDGTINFSGTLVGGTCSASINSGSSATATVSLPTTHVSALTSSAAVAGLTAYKIVLTGAGCSTSAGIATPYYEPSVSNVNTNGRLTNTGTASNVDIQLLNNAQTIINLYTDSSSQTYSTATTGTNSSSVATYTYPYYARYYATGTTTAGTVVGQVDYSIIYK
ncbi:fimbrial protein [Acinetobacter boissieri]|uniref:Major type 1 subunit fimbrin (Pilin) n=1 Tax=Acinetobacter boissieri TaxID=1219383 RepID=A0A1G6IU56_9GAMM|nr:type 1 fimbrial protein [Acinetobacter boissieri]SDC10029.1 major type 1 subunit fimbrin (pilin) [Acinetobacter boissieri]